SARSPRKRRRTGGPPHSRTLARWPRSLALPSGFGVRRPCGALDFPRLFMVPRYARKRMRAFPESTCWFVGPVPVTQRHRLLHVAVNPDCTNLAVHQGSCDALPIVLQLFYKFLTIDSALVHK